MQSAPIAPEANEAVHETDAEDETTVDSPVPDVLVHDELLIEEISIDGMCGVY
jgi:mycofactocin precursor